MLLETMLDKKIELNKFKEYIFDKVTEDELELYDEVDFMFLIHINLIDYVRIANCAEFVRAFGLLKAIRIFLSKKGHFPIYEPDNYIYRELMFTILYYECEKLFSSYDKFIAEFKYYNVEETELEIYKPEENVKPRSETPF